MYFSGQILDG